MADEALRERLKLLRAGNLTLSHPSKPASQQHSIQPTTTSTSKPVAKAADRLETKSSQHRSDPDVDLFRRLKALNPASALEDPDKPRLNQSVPRSLETQYKDEQEEIDDLIRQTQHLVQAERLDAASYQLDQEHESDHGSETESIGAIEREANEIIRMANDQVALERAIGTIPTDEERPSDNSAVTDSTGSPPSFGGALHCSDVDLEDELADAAMDVDYSSLTAGRGPGKTFRQARWNPRSTLFMLVAIVVLLSLIAIPGAHAFGAGNIPSISYLEGRAFRHGDLADVLAELARKTGGILGGSSKFSGMAIKRVYFGNWLRDYSQAMDVAALEKVPKQTILNIVMLLGFLAHGYATAEFEVTDERLGTYLPEEHLDNPKGYADGKDARKYDPRLRGPVDPRELEVDPRSGMKNYLANETGNWPTGSGLIRKTLKRVIDTGRRARQSGRDADLYEAYRLLGQALHTLEDLSAHSNWCELALHKLGHHQVFLHVGDNVKVQAPDGSPIAPLVTGTFGGADFVHSMLGEAQDHLSEASISDLNKAMTDAKTKSSGSQRSPAQDLLGLLTKIPGAGGDGVSRDLEEVSRGPAVDPSQMSPKEIYKSLWKILELRDRIAKSIETTMEKIPGLNALVEKLTNQLNVFVFTLIEPYAKPIMQQGMSALHLGSTAVINKEDQFEVFNNPNASDPTHSMLSKDHFGLILNEVAGNVAKIVVKHTVKLMVKAWDDNSIDAERTADECLAPMFHPYWFSGRSEVQKEMLDYVANWARSHPNEIMRLDREHVRNHTNTRSGKAEAHSHGGEGHSLSSFLGGGSSQAAQSFSSSTHHSASGQGASGGAGSGMGAQAANYASNFVSGKVHSALGGGEKGVFRGETGQGRNDDDDRIRYGNDGRHGSSQYQSHAAESSSYPHGDDRRQASGVGQGGGSSYGGGSFVMPDESRYAGPVGYGGVGGGGVGFPDQGYAYGGVGGGFPGQGYGHGHEGVGGFGPPSGPPVGMPMQQPFGGPPGYGSGGPPPFRPPPGGGGYGGGPGGFNGQSGGGSYY